jgi:hypothetical protein
MVKRKRTKGQTMIYKTLHRKLNVEPHLKPKVNSESVISSCSTSGTLHGHLVTTNPVIGHE